MKNKLILSTTLWISYVFSSSIVLAQQVDLAEKQEIVRQIKDEPASLDPAQAVGLPEIPILRDLFEGLTNQDAQGNPVPGVAESWHSSDQKTWVFKLRTNAKWSDGQPVTAADFVYSWRRLVDPKTSSPYAWFPALAGIQNAASITAGKLSPNQLAVTATDNTHLKVVLDRPVPWFPVLASSFALYPVSEKNISAHGAQWTLAGNLVSNGAYQLQQHIVNEQVVVVRNPHYWNNANTRLTQVTFVPLNNSVTATHWYQADHLDVTESFPKNMYTLLKQKLPGQVYTPAQLGTYYYAFNTRKGPTADQRVRQALSWSIDRKIIAERVLGTGEKPAWHFTPDVTNGLSATELPYQQLTQAERNQQAQVLLQAAGYGSKKPLKIRLLYNTSDNNKQIAIAVASMWKKTLGVQVELINQEWKTYIDSRKQGEFDVIRASWIGDYNEPSTFLTLLTASHSGNISGFNNTTYDEILAQAANAAKPTEREKDYQIAEQIIAEQVPIAPIYQYTNGRLIKPWVKGYPIDNPEDVVYSRELWIEKH